jgi:hypothetical protein
MPLMVLGMWTKHWTLAEPNFTPPRPACKPQADVTSA